MAEQSNLIRPPAWAGMFYPRNPVRLENMVTNLINEASSVSVDGDIIGLVVPHAGYEYSGATAAAAYKQIQDKPYDAVVILAPSHHELIRGVSIFSGTAYETPLGSIPVDQELSRAISNPEHLINLSDLGHRVIGQESEHSLEVQLPFLQVLYGKKLKIVAIVFHSQDYPVCQKLATAISAAIRNKNVLLVASSDLYHGYSYDELKSTDSQTLAAIEAGDMKAFCNGLESGDYMACGGGPIAALIATAKNLGAYHTQVVARANSADVTGSRGGWTVGYAAIVVYQQATG